MAKSKLEKAISAAADAFALQVVAAVKNATLQELMGLQLQGAVTATSTTVAPTAPAKRGPGRPKKTEVAAPAAEKKKRVVKNYPKCAYPRCTKNRFVRGKGFCGDHWRMWKDGKIKAAETYLKPAKSKPVKKTTKKKTVPKKKK